MLREGMRSEGNDRNIERETKSELEGEFILYFNLWSNLKHFGKNLFAKYLLAYISEKNIFTIYLYVDSGHSVSIPVTVYSSSLSH